jgi:hypothetical protein
LSGRRTTICRTWGVFSECGPSHISSSERAMFSPATGQDSHFTFRRQGDSGQGFTAKIASLHHHLHPFAQTAPLERAQNLTGGGGVAMVAGDRQDRRFGAFPVIPPRKGLGSPMDSRSMHLGASGHPAGVSDRNGIRHELWSASSLEGTTMERLTDGEKDFHAYRCLWRELEESASAGWLKIWRLQRRRRTVNRDACTDSA